MGAPLTPSNRFASSHALPVMAALIMGMTSTLVLTRPQRAPSARAVAVKPVVQEVVAPRHDERAHPAVDWTQTLAAPLLFLQASGYPSQRGPEAQGEAHTWLHDRGVRSLYLRVGEQYSLAWFEAQLGEPVFVSGPHGAHPDFDSDASFGHYNPRFISAAHQRFDELAATPGFIEVTRAPFQLHVQRQLETYLEAAQIVSTVEASTERAISRGYAAHMKAGEVPSMFLQEAWRPHTDQLEARGSDWYEANTALGFWTRRAVDETAPQLEGLMRHVLEVYDLPSTLHEDFEDGGC